MTPPSDVLVTGAGGFVGSALAEGFLALGWRVIAVDRAFDAPTRARLVAARLVTTDLTAAPTDDLPEASVIVHAAAITTDPVELGWTPAAHIAANVQPLLALLTHAARTTPRAFVFLSSSGVFAPGDGAECLRDTDVPTSRTPYAVAKRAGERLTLEALDGIAAHVVRLGYLYGPHELVRPSRIRVSLVARWIEAARRGEPLVVPANDPRRDWTCVSDLAPALARLVMAPPAAAPVHLASPHVVADSAMAALIAALVPGARVETGPAIAGMKAPMQPSDLDRLGPLSWTSPADGLAALAGAEVRA
ncbi:MAG: NAD-dependent epimerase/dehydratase family protein [Vicinamibacterales bacterium]